MNDKRILILTITAGGGHLQAAKAKYCELKTAYPDAFILEQDISFDWVGRWCGTGIKHLWGGSQARGNIFILMFFSHAHRYADYLIWLPVFFSTLRVCIKYNIDTIFDTQVMSTSAIVKALRIIKWWKGKEILLQKILTDLPTKWAQHFFRGIRHLSKKDRAFIRLLTTKPLLDQGETDALFWQTHCNLPMSAISYSKLPLRPAFFNPPDLKGGLDISIPSPGNLHITHKILSYGSISVTRSKDHISIPITPQDRVTVLMLGANPNPAVILSYTNHFIKILKKYQSPNRKDLFFIFCNSQISSLSNFRKQLLKLIQTTKDYPLGLTIIPIPHQNDLIVASLFHRSDATITKSGGLTSMELLTTAHGKIWIHQEAKKAFHQGMPPWEYGNALYLEAYKGAKLITPGTFENTSESYFSSVEEVPLCSENACK